MALDLFFIELRLDSDGSDLSAIFSARMYSDVLGCTRMYLDVLGCWDLLPRKRGFLFGFGFFFSADVFV